MNRFTDRLQMPIAVDSDVKPLSNQIFKESYNKAFDPRYRRTKVKDNSDT